MKLPTLNECVHCGLCLQECPTYRVTGRETQSPRGRIAAFRGIVEQRIEASAAIREGLEDCLVCRACESACPSGISMEAMMSGYREHERAKKADFSTRLERWWLEHVVAHPERLRIFAKLARLGSPFARAAGMEVPHATRMNDREVELTEMSSEGPERGLVVIVRGCIADEWFRKETRAAQRVLAANGWRVRLSEAGCCGALHRHAGLNETADELAEALSRMVRQESPDHVVVDSAGCASALLESTEITDTMSLLAREGWNAPAQKLPGRWALAPPCHQQHGEQLPDGSRFSSHTETILRAILESPPVSLAGNDLCCGAAGTYGLRRRKLSRAVGEMALERFIESDATGLITGNPGCLMRWQWLLGDVEVVHPVTLLDRCLNGPPATASPAFGSRS